MATKDDEYEIGYWNKRQTANERNSVAWDGVVMDIM